MFTKKEERKTMTNKEINDRGKKLADEHVDWFLKAIEPLLKSHMVHGFKHGVAETLGDRPADHITLVDNEALTTQREVAALRRGMEVHASAAPGSADSDVS